MENKLRTTTENFPANQIKLAQAENYQKQILHLILETVAEYLVLETVVEHLCFVV